MAEHKDLLDTSAHTHTPQGFSAASNSTLLTKNAAGSLVWQEKTSLLADIIPHGFSVISSASANAIAVATEYEQVAGTWTNYEAVDITWSTDHFSIDDTGHYVVCITGNATIAASSTCSVDINVGATIANGNEQGLTTIAAEGQAGSTQVLPISGVFYMSLTAGDKITPMITTDDGSSVTMNHCMLYIRLLHL